MMANRPGNPTNNSNNNTYNVDWQLNKSLLERNAFMFNNELASDVHFKLDNNGQTLTVPAHKYVLITGSPVFFAMFYGGLAGKEAEVEIPDVSPEAFLEMLRFLYCEEVYLTPELVMPTLYAAKKYMVPSLVERCKEFLETSLNLENVSTILNHSLLFDESDLSEKCLSYIDINSKAVFPSDVILRMSYESMIAILSRDTLRLDEIKIFDGVMKWADNICQHRDIEPTGFNKRQLLGEALQLIRFPIMSLKEFANAVPKTDVLISDEVNIMFQYFCCDERPKVPYSTTFRQTHQECTRFRCDRFVRTSSGWGYSGEADQITFRVDREIYIQAIGLYGSPTGPASYNVDLTIKENETILSQNEYDFNSSGNKLMYEVTLFSPILVKVNVSYTISAKITGAGSFYGQQGYQIVTRGGVRFEFMDPVKTSNGTGRCSGQIPSIIFCVHESC